MRSRAGILPLVAVAALLALVSPPPASAAEEYDEYLFRGEDEPGPPPAAAPAARPAGGGVQDGTIRGRPRVAHLPFNTDRTVSEAMYRIHDRVERYLLAAPDRFVHQPLGAAVSGVAYAELIAERLAAAGRFLDQGKAALAGFDTAGAVQALEEAAKATLPLIPDPQVRPVALDVLAALGAAYVQNADLDLGLEAFRLGLSLDPSFTLVGRGFDETAFKAFDKARGAGGPGPETEGGALVVSTDAAQAGVFVDGQFAGVAPTGQLPLSQGWHGIRVVMPGYPDYRSPVFIYPGQTKDLGLSLDRAPRTDQALAEIRGMHRAFYHEGLWPGAQALGNMFDLEMLLLSNVFVAGEAGTLEFYLYDIRNGLFKKTAGDFRSGEDPSRIVPGLLDDLLGPRIGFESVLSIASLPAAQAIGREGRQSVRVEPAPAVAGGTPWYKSWWFWTGVGVVAAGAATTTTLLLLRGGGGGDDASITIHF